MEYCGTGEGEIGGTAANLKKLLFMLGEIIILNNS